MAERMLGLVGGLGPESTLDYYRRIVDVYHSRAGVEHHPRPLIDSLDGGPLIGPMVAGDLRPIRGAVDDAVKQLGAAGAGLGLICSVASHVVFDEVAATSPMPLLSIVQATRRAAVDAGLHRPAVFGTRMAVDGAFFAWPFEQAGIELVRPAEPDRRSIHDAYLGELVRRVVLDSTRDRLLSILVELQTTARVDGLILGGTELSLILAGPCTKACPS